MKEPRPRSNYRRDLARAYHGQGETLRLRGDFIGSEEDFDKAIALRDGFLDEPDDIRSLAASHYSRAALLAQFPPRYAEAEGEFKLAIELMTGNLSEPTESNVSRDPGGGKPAFAGPIQGQPGPTQARPGPAGQALALHLEVQDISKSASREDAGTAGCQVATRPLPEQHRHDSL